MKGFFSNHRNRSAVANEVPWHLRMLSTPLRSHFACGTCAVTLIGLITWLWIHPDSLASDRYHTQSQIDDAIKLVSSRHRMQNRFQSATDRRSDFDSRIEHIAEWLPEERSWESIRQNLQSVAAATNVQMTALERRTTHYGTRVAVIELRCESQGTYADVCRFLQQIADQKMPIWCDEVRLVRSGQSNLGDRYSSDEGRPVVCLATLSLRAPFAGQETTAAKLLQRRADDEN
ncbi:MAG: hypothetical protein KDB00_26550 [Planctomycetales bacterium]|nr:hypothetical protein [Planctomycetales bacterium]